MLSSNLSNASLITPPLNKTQLITIRYFQGKIYLRKAVMRQSCAKNRHCPNTQPTIRILIRSSHVTVLSEVYSKMHIIIKYISDHHNSYQMLRYVLNNLQQPVIKIALKEHFLSVPHKNKDYTLRWSSLSVNTLNLVHSRGFTAPVSYAGTIVKEI